MGHQSVSVTRAIGCGLLAAILASTGIKLATAQEEGLRAKSVQSDRGRLVFPATAAIHARGVSRILGSLNEADAVRGFPNGFPLKRRITISLAVDWSDPTADARSHPAEALIVLPLSRALAWDDGKLHRIVRHELAHVGLAAYVEYRTIPRWFDEGFAEWASGGLTCEGRWRIWIEAQRRGKEGVAWPQQNRTASGLGDRLAYDLYSTFVEYLDTAWLGVVSSGALLSSVKEHGLDGAFIETLGTDRGSLLEGWRTYVAQRFATEPVCGPGDTGSLETRSSKLVRDSGLW